jgi:hypothetical protein
MAHRVRAGERESPPGTDRLGGGSLIRRRCRRPGPRGDRCAQGRIRRQDIVIPMPEQARRRDEDGEPVDELAGSEGSTVRPSGPDLGRW